MEPHVLEVLDLHKVYSNGVYALRGLSFVVKKGEIYGLIGPNGSGKTTTLRIIAGLVKPTKGLIRIAGFDIVKKPEITKQYIGYLPEEADVYYRLTGLEHIEFYAKLYGLDSEAVEYGVKLSGLGDRLYDEAGTYSKGMKRRLLLAITLMRKPMLAILDEPTSGLDVQASLKVRDIIKQFVRESSSSVVISSHNMLEIEYLADRIGLIYKGKLVFEGAPADVLKKTNSSNLEEAFVKIIENSGVENGFDHESTYT
ncbi:MAG: ABC transporter ATP-binding protein [Desulfurococcaceae archaeon]